MNVNLIVRNVTALGIGLSLGLFNSHAYGQITNIISSDVEGFFGSQSDFVQQDEGPLSPSWFPNGAGPYGITGVPNVPALYGGFPGPSWPVVQNIPFDAPGGGHVLGTPFVDSQGTMASYGAFGDFNGAGTNTSDAFVQLGPAGAAGMWLAQSSTATGYAFEQANLAIDYNVGAGGLLGGAAPALPYFVSGNLQTGGYVEFEANLTYWFLTVNPGTTIVGSITNLGSVQYSYNLTSSPGPFGTVVNHNAANLLGATGSGILEITGTIFVSGDPSSIYVSSVPEPSTVALALMGATGCGIWARRKRARR